MTQDSGCQARNRTPRPVSRCRDGSLLQLLPRLRSADGPLRPIRSDRALRRCQHLRLRCRESGQLLRPARALPRGCFFRAVYYEVDRLRHAESCVFSKGSAALEIAKRVLPGRSTSAASRSVRSTRASVRARFRGCCSRIAHISVRHRSRWGWGCNNGLYASRIESGDKPRGPGGRCIGDSRCSAKSGFSLRGSWGYNHLSRVQCDSCRERRR